jgi:hypothetical protein
MRRILLDENIPVGLKGLLTAYDVATADEMGWVGITNGELLAAAELDGFAIMITADRNIHAQQRLAGRAIALVVVTTNHWDTIRENAAPIVAAPARRQRRGLTSWSHCPELSAAGGAQIRFRHKPAPGR